MADQYIVEFVVMVPGAKDAASVETLPGTIPYLALVFGRIPFAKAAEELDARAKEGRVPPELVLPTTEAQTKGGEMVTGVPPLSCISRKPFAFPGVLHAVDWSAEVATKDPAEE